MQKAPWTDLARLRSAIQHSLPGRIRDQGKSIVDIGCGACDECGMLLELFPNAVVTLVELDRKYLDRLARWQGVSSRQIRVIPGDARQLAAIAPGPYDFAIIRHPDLDSQPEAWAEVLNVAAKQLTAAGFLMIVTYTTAEAEAAQMILRSLSLQEMGAGSPNRVPVALAGNDRYILIYKQVDF